MCRKINRNHLWRPVDSRIIAIKGICPIVNKPGEVFRAGFEVVVIEIKNKIDSKRPVKVRSVTGQCSTTKSKRDFSMRKSHLDIFRC